MFTNKLGFEVVTRPEVGQECQYGLLEFEVSLDAFNSYKLSLGDKEVVIHVRFNYCKTIDLWLEEYEALIGLLTRPGYTPSVMELEALVSSFDGDIDWSEIEEWLTPLTPEESEEALEEHLNQKPFLVYGNAPYGRIAQRLTTGEFLELSFNARTLTQKQAFYMVLNADRPIDWNTDPVYNG